MGYELCTAQALHAVELMTMARKRMEEVDYVYEAYRKYRKLNPMIAYNNTMMADRNNVTRFDGYADEAIRIIGRIPKEAFDEQEILKDLAWMVLNEYEKEGEALDKRLQIYDSKLYADAKRARKEKAEKLRADGRAKKGKQSQELQELIARSVELEMQKTNCEVKLRANEEVCEKYKRSILWKKQAKKTMDQAEKYISESREKILKLEAEMKLVKEEIVEKLA